MKEVRAFTNQILKELERRAKPLHQPMSAGIEKHMVSLESLLKKKPSGNEAGEAAAPPASGKRIITEKDLLELEGAEEFVIRQGDIVTPLAKDLLKKKKIRLTIR